MMKVAFRTLKLLLLLTALLLLDAATAIPQCEEGEQQLEQSCDIFASSGGLSWALIDFRWPLAVWDSKFCNGKLSGVRCFAGSGFTAVRYNKWECEESCSLS